MLSLFLSTNTDCSMLRVGETKGSGKLDPTTQIPETVFGHKPISLEAVTARSAKSHADSYQISLGLFFFLFFGRRQKIFNNM